MRTFNRPKRSLSSCLQVVQRAIGANLWSVSRRQAVLQRLRGARSGPFWRWVLAAALIPALQGCSPALDWRTVTPPGWGVSFTLPCRPTLQERTVPLDGQSLRWRLASCAAEATTFAVASVDVGDPARVPGALASIGAAARANVQGQIVSEAAAQVPGMTPHAAARRWELAGKRPDGQAVAMQVLVFAHGTRVFQATVLGTKLTAPQVQPMFEGLRPVGA